MEKLEDKCIYWVPKPKHKWFYRDKSKCAECDGYDRTCEDYESRKHFALWLEGRKTKYRE